MRPENIPLELRASSRWVNWCLIDELKVILDAKTGRGAKAWPDNPNVWSSFKRASQRVSKPSRKRGWGLVIDAPFIGVDFDDCIDNGKLNARASAFVSKLPATYAETSPSGRGLHLWYRCKQHAKLPNQAVGLFEVYARRRYLTITANKTDGALDQVTELSFDAAMEIFRMAQPSAFDDSEFYSRYEPTEEGFWSAAAMLALLEAWQAVIPGFKFVPDVGKWSIPCPGNSDGWLDGNIHSIKNPPLSRNSMVWVQNGWPVFHCFHAHCAEKTWRHLVDFYDPLRIYFDFDIWQENRLAELDDNG